MYGNSESKNSFRLGTVLVILAIIVSAVAVLFALHAETDNSSAAEIVEYGVCGPDTYYKYFSDGTLEISGYGWTYNYSGTVRSPWFDYRTEITKIVIRDNVTDLGAWTFVGCKNVTELTMPISLNTVGSDLSPAFAGCYRIEKIDFTYGTDGRGPDYDAYYGNDKWYQNAPWYESRDSLREINFADGIVGIGSNMFRELNITSLTIPDTVVALGNHVFFNCAELTDLTYPVSLCPFCDRDYPAFEGCAALEKVIFTNGNGVPFGYYPPWTFPGDTQKLAPWNMNSGVAKTIIVSDNVSSLGNNMFYSCNIRELTLPVSIYPNGAFNDNNTYCNLEKVTMTKGTGISSDYWSCGERSPWNASPYIKTVIVEEGATYIGSEMFRRCLAENLILPDTIESLGRSVFKSAEIKNLTIPITLNAVWLGENSAFEDVSGFEKITFTHGNTGYGFNYSADKDTNCWYQLTPWYQCRSTLKEIVFGDGIQRIGSNAFRELNVTSLTIPDSVQTLSEHSFYRCEKLVDLTIPITLDTVCSDTQPAFDQCNSIQGLRLTAGMTGIGWDYKGDRSPVWCTSGCWLVVLSVDAGITHIGTNTFSGYTFISPSGSTLPHTADNLSGHVYTGSAGILNMQSTDGSGATTVPNPVADVHPENSIDMVPIVAFGLLMAAIVVPVGAWIRKDSE